MANEGAAPNTDVVLLLLLVLLLEVAPKMLLVDLAIAVVVVGGTTPKENAPELVPPALVVLVGCCEVVLPKAKLELTAGCWPKVGLLAAAPPNMPEVDGDITELVELLVMLLNAGGAVVGGTGAANPPPNTGAAELVIVEPNEVADVAVVVVIDPNPNFATAGAPKAGFDPDAEREGATEAAPPKVNALVVVDGVVVATAAVVVEGFMFDAPNAKPPEVVAVPPLVDVTTLPNDGRLEALVVIAVDEPVGERGLKALNPDPLPKVEMVD